jgi:hypothetical protein
MRAKRRVPLASLVVVGLLGGVVAVGASGAGAQAAVTPVITGLNAPRGHTFDSAGSLYVSESGVPAAVRLGSPIPGA